MAVPVTMPPGLTGVVAVAAGASHSLALKGADGTVWAWGLGTSGQLGDNIIGQRTTPFQTLDLTGVAGIAAGQAHSVALKGEGTVWAWGANFNGQLGDGTTTQRLRPVSSSGLGGVTGIAAGGSTTLAVRTEGHALGSVWAWGFNFNGQLGDGSTANRSAPVHISGAASAVAAADGHSLALRSLVPGTARAWAWGADNLGQLGDNNATASTIPVAVQGSHDVLAVAGGGSHSLAAGWDGKVYAWGANASGQLGDGTTTTRRVPVAVYGLSLFDAFWFVGDADGDGLATAAELALGSDPVNPDTNGDGVQDGAQVTQGTDPLDLDVDDDGVANATELENGTDPFRADTDGDGVGDAADCFPLDPARFQCPAPTPGDLTPPVITLQEPTNAVLIGSNPPGD